MAVAKLTLYIVDGSPELACERAVDSVHRAFRRFAVRSVELVVRNLSRVPECDRTAADRGVLIVPTLAMTEPQQGYLAGNFDARQIVDFLCAAGLVALPGPDERR